jgi:hypothetical protein
MDPKVQLCVNAIAKVAESKITINNAAKTYSINLALLSNLASSVPKACSSIYYSLQYGAVRC